MTSKRKKEKLRRREVRKARAEHKAVVDALRSADASPYLVKMNAKAREEFKAIMGSYIQDRLEERAMFPQLLLPITVDDERRIEATLNQSTGVLTAHSITKGSKA